MRVVLDYTVENTPLQEFGFPKGGRILALNMVGGKPTLSILHDPEAPILKIKLKVFRTGERFDEGAEKYNYIGTFMDGIAAHLVEVVS